MLALPETTGTEACKWRAGAEGDASERAAIGLKMRWQTLLHICVFAAFPARPLSKPWKMVRPPQEFPCLGTSSKNQTVEE